MSRSIFAAYTLIICLLAGCGTPGAPQPPSLRLPKPVEDLRAVRRGDKVNLTWTMPNDTTDGEGLRGTISVRVCRGFRSQAEKACNQVAADVPYLAKIAAEGSKQKFTDDLTGLLQNPQGRDFVNYSVEVFNDRGRSAGPSNAQTIFLAPMMSPPSGLKASVASDAIVLTWQPVAEPPSSTLHTDYRYRLLRSAMDAGSKDGSRVSTAAEFGSNEKTSYRDTSFDWQRTYTYQILGVTRVLSREGQLLSEFDGEPSEPVTVTANDTFPPATPEGLQAVYAGAVDPKQNFIDLTWTPNVEPDLAGYNVYRMEPTKSVPVKINRELAPTPSFRDATIEPGIFTYVVTAVDARGNESPRSQPAAETVPQTP
jgi:hypothetical protein